MKKFDLIGRRLNGYAQSKVEERESGAFYKVQEVDAYIARRDLELEAKDKRIAELESNQAKRDLEQQAKGICDFYNDYFHNKFTSTILAVVKNDLEARFKELRKLAKELDR
jgi:hypothetical protein